MAWDAVADRDARRWVAGGWGTDRACCEDNPIRDSLTEQIWSGIKHDQLLVVLAQALIAGAMLFSLPLQQLAHQRSQRPSTALLFFWLLVLFLGGVGLRTAIDERDYEEHPARFAVTIVGLALSLVTFGLVCLSPEGKPQAIKLGDDDEGYEAYEAPCVVASIGAPDLSGSSAPTSSRA